MLNDAESNTAYLKHILISDTFDGLVIQNYQTFKKTSQATSNTAQF